MKFIDLRQFKSMRHALRVLVALFFLLLPFARVSHAAPSFVKETAGCNFLSNVPTPETYTCAITVTNAGDLLVMQFSAYNAACTVVPSDNNGGVWTHVSTLPSSVSPNLYDQWYSLNHNSGATTVTLTLTGACFSSTDLTEYTKGAGESFSFDTQSSTSNASNPLQTGLANFAGANELLVGGICNHNNVTATPTDYGSGGGTPTALTNFSTSGSYGQSAYQIITGTGQFGFRWASSSTSAGGIAGYIAGSAPTPTPTATPTPSASYHGEVILFGNW